MTRLLYFFLNKITRGQNDPPKERSKMLMSDRLFEEGPAVPVEQSLMKKAGQVLFDGRTEADPLKTKRLLDRSHRRGRLFSSKESLDWSVLLHIDKKLFVPARCNACL